MKFSQLAMLLVALGTLGAAANDYYGSSGWEYNKDSYQYPDHQAKYECVPLLLASCCCCCAALAPLTMVAG